MQRRAFLSRLALTTTGLLVASDVLEQLTRKRSIFPSAWPEGPVRFVHLDEIPGSSLYRSELYRARFNFDNEIWQIAKVSELPERDWIEIADVTHIH